MNIFRPSLDIILKYVATTGLSKVPERLNLYSGATNSRALSVDIHNHPRRAPRHTNVTFMELACEMTLTALRALSASLPLSLERSSLRVRGVVRMKSSNIFSSIRSFHSFLR